MRYRHDIYIRVLIEHHYTLLCRSRFVLVALMVLRNLLFAVWRILLSSRPGSSRGVDGEANIRNFHRGPRRSSSSGLLGGPPRKCGERRPVHDLPLLGGVGVASSSSIPDARKRARDLGPGFARHRGTAADRKCLACLLMVHRRWKRARCMHPLCEQNIH